MIGNIEDATAAFEGALSRIGDGSSRDVYIDNDKKVVYKVECEPGWYSTNQLEWENYNEFSDVPLPFVIPETALYDIDGSPVIAMEYIDGQLMAECYCSSDECCTDFCLPRALLDIACTIINDTSGLNFVYRDGFYYVIDFAC